MFLKYKNGFYFTIIIGVSTVLFVITMSWQERLRTISFTMSELPYRKQSAPPSFKVPELLRDYSKKFKLSPFKLDSQSLYHVHESTIVADNKSSSDVTTTVCLATIASLDVLYHLVELSEHWTGPASVAIFFQQHYDLQLVVTYLHVLRMCFAAIRNNFSFHFVTPASENVRQDDVVWESDELFHCQDHAKVLKQLVSLHKRRKWKRLLFPQNHLRNVARDGCASSRFFYLTDVDIIPQFGLYPRLAQFLDRRPPCSKCLYVVPAFEGIEMAKHPRTKYELLQRTGNHKDFRVYHIVAFYKNQRATNFAKWKQLGNSTRLDAAYEVKFEFGYECFYVATHHVPKYREIFIGYGFTRNVQALEAYLAGFKFYVLNDTFMIHRGMRNTTANDRYRTQEKQSNYRVFLKFRETLQKRYGRGMEFV